MEHKTGKTLSTNPSAISEAKSTAAEFMSHKSYDELSQEGRDTKLAYDVSAAFHKGEQSMSSEAKQSEPKSKDIADAVKHASFTSMAAEFMSRKSYDELSQNERDTKLVYDVSAALYKGEQSMRKPFTPLRDIKLDSSIGKFMDEDFDNPQTQSTDEDTYMP